jgi:hypothetical protein
LRLAVDLIRSVGPAAVITPAVCALPVRFRCLSAARVEARFAGKAGRMGVCWRAGSALGSEHASDVWLERSRLLYESRFAGWRLLRA